MIKIEMVGGGAVPTILCNICGEAIEHHSEGMAVFQYSGSLLRFHHRTCASGGFTAHWPSVPIAEAMLSVVKGLGIAPAAPREEQKGQT